MSPAAGEKTLFPGTGVPPPQPASPGFGMQRSLSTSTSFFGLASAVVAGVVAERNLEARRQSLIRQAQSLRLNFRRVGWSTDAEELLRQAARIRVDDTLRNEAATSLIGLDAISAKEFKNQGASSLAFDPSGKKLILGAHSKGRGSSNQEWPARPVRSVSS